MRETLDDKMYKHVYCPGCNRDSWQQDGICLSCGRKETILSVRILPFSVELALQREVSPEVSLD